MNSLPIGPADTRIMAANLRLIARLDIKGPNLIKGIQFEGVRKLGDPAEFAKRYYDQGIDEIICMDAVASLYDREKLVDIVARTAENVFVPITAGGGLRELKDAREILRAGADKVAINSAATHRPEIISEIAATFGSQCMVLSIEAKRTTSGGWEAYRDGGREHTGLDAIEWAARGAALGAGEILITSVDREGMRGGFDIELTRRIADAVNIPVIASGGMGKISHLIDIARDGAVDAVAMAHVLHYGKISVADIRQAAAADGLPVRLI